MTRCWPAPAPRAGTADADVATSPWPRPPPAAGSAPSPIPGRPDHRQQPFGRDEAVGGLHLLGYEPAHALGVRHHAPRPPLVRSSGLQPLHYSLHRLVG